VTTLSENKTLIPGQKQLFSGSREFPKSIMLVVGTSGSGKTAYSMQFLRGASPMEIDAFT
jgi:KaiC/GvpD/RAD55 family RecA-like ATPase